MSLCQLCGVPLDAGFFDESRIVVAPEPGKEQVLARFQLHRNHCGVLLYFSQYVETGLLETPGYQWQIRWNGQPRAPYLGFEHIVNPWGMAGFPLNIRLDEGALLELVIANTGGDAPIGRVGGRVVGRHWYNSVYGSTV